MRQRLCWTRGRVAGARFAVAPFGGWNARVVEKGSRQWLGRLTGSGGLLSIGLDVELEASATLYRAVRALGEYLGH